MNSEFEYDLHGLYDTSTISVGVDDRFGDGAAAQFILSGDGKELWRIDVLNKSAPLQAASDVITGARKLTLKAIDQGQQTARAQVD